MLGIIAGQQQLWLTYAVSLLNLEKNIVWTYFHTSLFPACCIYMWLLPDLPCHVWKLLILWVGVQLIPHLLG